MRHRPIEQPADCVADFVIDAGIGRIVARERQVVGICAETQRAGRGGRILRERGRSARAGRNHGEGGDKQRFLQRSETHLRLPPLRWVQSTVNTNSAPPSGVAASILVPTSPKNAVRETVRPTTTATYCSPFTE